MKSTKSSKGIKVYEDKHLLDLIGQRALLDNEKVPFMLGEEINENGRTIDDVWRDEIKILKRTNEYLSQKYSDNEVASSEIAANEFYLQTLEEKIEPKKEDRFIEPTAEPEEELKRLFPKVK